MTLDHVPDAPGRYRVTTTSGSIYVFDMVDRTVTRTPGPDSHPDFTDGQHVLLRIIQGQVGVSGFWTMQPEPEVAAVLEYLWQVTSPIVAIDRIDGD